MAAFLLLGAVVIYGIITVNKCRSIRRQPRLFILWLELVSLIVLASRSAYDDSGFKSESAGLSINS